PRGAAGVVQGRRPPDCPRSHRTRLHGRPGLPGRTLAGGPRLGRAGRADPGSGAPRPGARSPDALAPAAAGTGPRCGNGVRLGLEAVVNRWKILRRSARSMRQRLSEQPGGEPRVPGEERSVQIRPDRAADATALVPAFAVVPEPGEDPAERLRAHVQHRAAGVVFEPGQGSHPPRLELALEQHVADHPSLPGDGVMREEPDARTLGAVPLAVEAAEQLVAAADRQQRSAVFDRLDQARLAGEVGGDQGLLTILTAADVEQVVLAGPDLLPDPNRLDLELVAAPGRPPAEDRDVAAGGVDVQVVGVEVADADLHAACSQSGFANPRSVTIRRRASIAV